MKQYNLGGVIVGMVTLSLAGIYAFIVAEPLGTPNTIDSDAECICAGIAFVIAAIGMCTIGISLGHYDDKEPKQLTCRTSQ